MTETLPAVPEQSDEMTILERVVVMGDLAQLTAQERVSYYSALCHSLKLNPLSRPFEYLKLSGKLVLYARKDCAEQLRRLHNVSIIDLKGTIEGDLYVVTATAQTPAGRCDMDQGAVDITGLRGEALANARLKATTKAKRRVTLSLCGLGVLDETEVESIPGARTVRVDEATGEILDAPALPPPATAHFPIPESEAAVCAECGVALTPGQSRVSIKAFGKALCPDHQHDANRTHARAQPTAATRAASERAREQPKPEPSERDRAKLEWGKLAYRASQVKLKLPALPASATVEEIREMIRDAEEMLFDAEQKQETAA